VWHPRGRPGDLDRQGGSLARQAMSDRADQPWPARRPRLLLRAGSPVVAARLIGRGGNLLSPGSCRLGARPPGRAVRPSGAGPVGELVHQPWQQSARLEPVHAGPLRWSRDLPARKPHNRTDLVPTRVRCCLAKDQGSPPVRAAAPAARLDEVAADRALRAGPGGADDMQYPETTSTPVPAGTSTTESRV
jgi:hypothetical protein